MRVLFVSQYFPPESNAPANRVSRLARSWATRHGLEVTVLTGFPNHPEGRIYPGFDARRPALDFEGPVRVIRTPIYMARNAGVIRRSLSYASFWASASLLGPWLVEEPPEVVIATSPQLLVGLAGAWLAHRFRVPFVLEVRDLWPDSVVAVGAMSEKNPGILVLRLLERAIYACADHVVIVAESFRDILIERGVSPERISFIPNGVDRDLFTPGPPPEPDPYPGRFVVCFAGTVGMAHGLATVLEAARMARPTMPELLFLVVGEGAERPALEERARKEGLDNVHFTGRLPREAIPPLLRRADLSLVMLRPDPLFRTVLPSKLFESMGCGRPILLGVDGEARRLVERAGAGVYFPPDNPRALLEAITRLRSQPEERKAMGERGHAFVVHHFDREALAARYAELLHEVSKRTPPKSKEQPACPPSSFMWLEQGPIS
ncbi:MAG: glycosyltransferase family 4 protein [Sandaracinaceae bacterium]|nr:glycosyltransferase family 4 protein [Sandaracinaceae bacterium]